MLRRIRMIRETTINNENDKVLGPPKPPTPMSKGIVHKLQKCTLSRSSTGEYLRGSSPKASIRMRIAPVRDERHPSVVDSIDIAISQQQVRCISPRR
mmetsp:Transcript_54365/g.80644  ORF Transcript_54365/g.80644 Transcript_54365/m.80644 type:complete len:97 (-) Transcript_54365:169-459(-)